MAEAVGVFHILLSGKATEHRLRNCVVRQRRLIMPVLRSVSTYPAFSVKPRLSFSFRKAIDPVSEVACDQWTDSLRWQSKRPGAAPVSNLLVTSAAPNHTNHQHRNASFGDKYY